MDNTPEAWILTIGNEIINGVITDTNREAIARELRSVGISIKGMSSVGDDPPLIADALAHTMERAGITVVSGGLGPTEDDKTAAAVADFLGVCLKSDPEQLARIEERFPPMGPPHGREQREASVFSRGGYTHPQ